jgi:DNA-binding response OmpR family regulator
MSKKILIVEDDADTVDMMKCALRSPEYDLEECESLAQAVPILHSFSPDVALLDLSTCDIPIAEFAPLCAPKTRIIIVSASARLSEVAVELKMRFFLGKPFDPQTLIRLINDAIVSGEHAAVEMPPARFL